VISSQDWTVPEAASQKIPESWGDAQPNKKKPGWRWRDPANQGNGVRIDRGDADSSFPSQRVDHVILRKDGQPILDFGFWILELLITIDKYVLQLEKKVVW
jgi:hypothetical protein